MDPGRPEFVSGVLEAGMMVRRNDSGPQNSGTLNSAQKPPGVMWTLAHLQAMG